MQQWSGALQFHIDEDPETHNGHDSKARYERRAEPVVLVAFFEHGFETAETKRHGENAQPVSLTKQMQLWRRRFERVPKHRNHDEATRQAEKEDRLPAESVAEVAAERRADGRCKN